MRSVPVLIVYARNDRIAQAEEIVDAEKRVGFVRFKNPKFWETSGVAELLTVPGAKYSRKTEEWSFDQSQPEVWVLAGSEYEGAIISAYEEAGVPAKVVGAPPPKPKARPRAKRKSKARKAPARATAEE